MFLQELLQMHVLRVDKEQGSIVGSCCSWLFGEHQAICSLTSSFCARRIELECLGTGLNSWFMPVQSEKTLGKISGRGNTAESSVLSFPARLLGAHAKTQSENSEPTMHKSGFSSS